MFTHLHVHSEYSLTDGLSNIKELVSKVKSLGMTACALTDHGTAAGLVSFYDECKKQGIKPILGCEVYEAPVDRFEKSTDENGDRYFHLILLVKNEQGYKNLCKLVTRGNSEGFYYRPRIDMKLLEECHEGLICLSACIAGRVPKAIIRGQYSYAEELIEKYKSIFGDDYYLEIQNHNIPEEKIVNTILPQLAHKHGVKLVATNDSHYVNTEDAEAHKWLIAIGQKKKVKEFVSAYDTGDYSIKTEEQMKELFQESLHEAITNTMEIADKCNFDFTYGEYRMPKVVIPKEWGEDYYGYLESEAWKGYEERYPVGNVKRKEAEERLKYELSVIKQMGFAKYFLDTRKTIMWAHNHKIMTGPGRGCQKENGLVYTTNGIKKIQDVKVGDFVYDMIGIPSKVINTFAYDVNEPMLELTIPYGGKVCFTKDHKFLTVPSIPINNKKLIAQGYKYADNKPSLPKEWKKAQDLRVGDWVMLPISVAERTEKIFPKLKETPNKPNNQIYYIDNDYIYMRIKYIDEINYEGKVYDLSVGTNQEPSYCTNACVVHNSGAGSIMNYCLGITDIEPLQYNLLFERFLNPSRISMPKRYWAINVNLITQGCILI